MVMKNLNPLSLFNMLNNKEITKIVFMDIECCPIYDTFGDLPQKLKNLFAEKYSLAIGEQAYQEYNGTKKKEGDLQLAYQKAYNDVYAEKAVLSPEFSQIICISIGMITETFEFKGMSFSGANDKEILLNFITKTKFIDQDKGVNNEQYVCIYNSGFDVPFLSKRLLYNSLAFPAILDNSLLKPWEKGFLIDPKDNLKFGGFDAPSLESLCTALSIPTALDTMGEPSGLAGKFKAGEYKFIEDYCMADTFALACAYLKLYRSPKHPNGITNPLIKV